MSRKLAVREMDADELLEILHENGLSPAEMGHIIGVTYGAVMHWVRGSRKIPSWFVRLTDYLDRQGLSFIDYNL